jgi:23S rRNA pseudouridine2605 synthase
MNHEPLHPLDPRRRKGETDGQSRPRKNVKKFAGHKGAKPTKPARPMKRRRRPAAKGLGPPAGTVRIQKVLAQAGVASRRSCEELVLDGRVTVNGQVVTELPIFVRLGADRVALDGQPISIRPEEPVYLLLNKPRGVVCTSSDPAGRPRAIDLVPGVEQRVFPVGRLETESTGIILMTNDGELANRITHPRYGVEKTYVVEVIGPMEPAALEQLKVSSYMDGRKLSGAAVKVIRRSRESTLIEVRLREGPNREVRRILARLGYKVRSLRRVAIGPVTDRGVKTGNYRVLSKQEVELLRKASSPAKQ